MLLFLLLHQPVELQERDLFTDRECTRARARKRTQTSPDFIFHLLPCRSRSVSVSLVAFVLHLDSSPLVGGQRPGEGGGGVGDEVGGGRGRITRV